MKTISRLAQAYLQTPWRRQVQILSLILLGVLFIVMVASIYLNVSARAATYGRQILFKKEEIQKLQFEIADQRAKLGFLLSTREMEQRALDMGFQPIEKGELTFVVVPGYIVRQSAVLAPAPKPVEPLVVTLPPSFSESLVDWLTYRLLILPDQAQGGAP